MIVLRIAIPIPHFMRHLEHDKVHHEGAEETLFPGIWGERGDQQALSQPLTSEGCCELFPVQGGRGFRGQ